MLRLIPLQGTMLGQIVPLGSPDTTIGRDPGNTLAFPNDNALSRYHLRILRNGDSYTVEDVGSTNGSFLNGRKIVAPSPLSHNDEIRIGGQVFRAEAEFVPQSAPRRQEVSSGEAAPAPFPTRGAEYPKSGIGDMFDLGGCAMPKFDADGCLKYLWYLLIVAIVAILIAGIVYVVGIGIGALGGAGASAGGAAAPPQATPAGPQGGGAGDNQPPPDQAPPPDDNRTTAGIELLEVKIDYARRDGKHLQPVVLLKWRNVGFPSVTHLVGKIRLYDKSNRLLLTKEKQTLYRGPEVEISEVHEDRLPLDGTPIPDPLPRIPGSAQVVIEKAE